MSDYDYARDDVDYVYVTLYYHGYRVLDFVTRPDRLWGTDMTVRKFPKYHVAIDKIVVRSDHYQGMVIQEYELRGAWG